MNEVIELAARHQPRSTTENGRVTPPKRQPNAERRSREYLTHKEVETLIKAARKTGRHGHRDATLILVAYRHGLRVAELVALRWEQVDLEAGLLHVRRLKNGTDSTHPLRGPEIRALRRLRRDYPETPYARARGQRARGQACKMASLGIPGSLDELQPPAQH